MKTIHSIVVLLAVSMFALFSCQEVTAPEDNNPQYITGTVNSVKYIGDQYGFGSATFDPSTAGLRKITTSIDIHMYGPDTSTVWMIISTPQNVTRTFTYNMGSLANFMAGNPAAVIFTLLPGETYNISFKVDGGLGQALPVEFQDESGMTFEPHHAVYADDAAPNGGMAWELTPDKLNDGTLKIHQGYDNRNEIHQVVVMLRKQSMIVDTYPDLVDELSDFSANYPPSMQCNYSDYIARGGNSSLNYKLLMHVVEVDGEQLAYYSYLVLETSNKTYANFIRFFSAAHPIEPKIGGVVGVVSNGHVEGSVELLHLFTRDDGHNNSEYVNTFGLNNGLPKTGEENAAIVLHGTGNGGSDDFVLDCDNSEYRVFDDGDTTRVKWTPELDRLHAMLWSFDYDHAQLLCKLGVKVRYSSDASDTTQNHEDHYQTLEILSQNGDVAIVATSQIYVDPGSGTEGYWVFSSDDVANAVATMQDGDVLLWKAHYAGPMPAEGEVWNEDERHSSHFYLIKGYTDETWN